VSVFVYADGIILVAPSVDSKFTSIVDFGRNFLLDDIDMRSNASKSLCIRFGPRYNADCVKLTTRNGQLLVNNT